MHRLEPALDAADQRVVVEALIVRLMRLERDLVFARARRQRRVSAAAIAMAIGQIRVELKMVQLSAKRTQSDNAPQPSSSGRIPQHRRTQILLARRARAVQLSCWRPRRLSRRVYKDRQHCNCAEHCAGDKRLWRPN